MVCTSKGQAIGVSRAGFAKMESQGYTCEAIADGLYAVALPGQTVQENKYYTVLADADMVEFVDGKFCDCAFADANREFGVCKHLLFVQAEIALQARIEAAENEMADYSDYLADLAQLDGERWPSCPYHGDFEETPSGAPALTCQRCEKYRFP